MEAELFPEYVIADQTRSEMLEAALNHRADIVLLMTATFKQYLAAGIALGASKDYSEHIAVANEQTATLRSYTRLQADFRETEAAISKIEKGQIQ